MFSQLVNDLFRSQQQLERLRMQVANAAKSVRRAFPIGCKLKYVITINNKKLGRQGTLTKLKIENRKICFYISNSKTGKIDIVSPVHLVSSKESINA